MNRFFILILIGGLLCIQGGAVIGEDGSLRNPGRLSLPGIILWAWERPVDLSFIDPNEIGVAYLAKTIFLSGEKIFIRPRLQPLNVPKGTCLIAVARIESDHSGARAGTRALGDSQRDQVVSAVVEMAKWPDIAAIQLDYDSTLSERSFHREVLFEIRRRIPSTIPFSVTALASWCIHDGWLEEVPIEEAIPMLFRMGPESRHVRTYLEEGGDFSFPSCRKSIGVSTDECLSKLPRGRRWYVFHPGVWSRDAVDEATREAKKWQ